MMRIRLILLFAVLNGIISWKYWWNYNYSEGWIAVVGKSEDPEPNHILVFHKHLKLIDEDLYKVIGTDNGLVNKEIAFPIHGALYEYNHFEHRFELVFKQ